MAWRASMEERLAAVEKRRKTSITLTVTYQEQGQEYLGKTEALRLEDVIVPLDPGHLRHLAAAAVGPLQAAQRATWEGPVQDMMLMLTSEILSLTRLPSRRYLDTSQTGLLILPAGRRAKPDLAGCEGDACASNVSIIMEAKKSLESHTSDYEAAFQVVQRSLQLLSQQSSRTKWVFASVGNRSARVFHIQIANKVVTRMAVTDRLPLSASADSPGLMALLRLHSTPADLLGWLPSTAALPTDLQLGGQQVGQLHNLMPADKPSTGSSQVVAGVVETPQGSINVYCKTSPSVEDEISALKVLQTHNIHGVAAFRGQTRDKHNRLWLIATPVERSTLHTSFLPPADLRRLILKVATTVETLAEVGLFHSDISANILETGDLIDFQTVWHAQAPLSAKLTFSLQYVAIARLEYNMLPPTLRSELESVMYTFLYAATKDLLHWKHDISPVEALNAKDRAMRLPDVFNSKVLARVGDAGLRDVARKLQSLIFCESRAVDVRSFKSCFEA
ncbi:hypothetical protein WJX74_003739 [Apatococcus lobatus]|uniref:Fungal-type protein kinase domain-containing protein n=1 Tax=Apatococcus lobatus TaxID=904363 RepID=A0AAW1RP73_9CHLO